MLSKRLATWLLVVVSCVLCTASGELLARSLLPRPGFQSYSAQWPQGLLVPHPTRDYAYAPNVSREIRSEEYQITVTTNSFGLRADPIQLGERIDVLAVGDSFTAGFGVDADDAWPKRLEASVRGARADLEATRIVNAGVSGYNLRQIRRTVEELVGLGPRVVIVGVYPSRVWRLKDPYVYFEGNAVLQSSVPHLRPTVGGFLYSELGVSWLRDVHFWSMKRFALGAHLLTILGRTGSGVANLSDRLLNRLDKRPGSPRERIKEEQIPILAELDELRLLCRNWRIDLVVVLVNEQHTDGRFDELDKERNQVITRFCMMAGIPVFDPVPAFEGQDRPGRNRFRIGKDHHWSREAHRLVGERLAAFLLEQRLLQGSAEPMATK